MKVGKNRTGWHTEVRDGWKEEFGRMFEERKDDSDQIINEERIEEQRKE